MQWPCYMHKAQRHLKSCARVCCERCQQALLSNKAYATCTKVQGDICWAVAISSRWYSWLMGAPCRHCKVTHVMLTIPSPCYCLIYQNCVVEHKFDTGMKNKFGVLGGIDSIFIACLWSVKTAAVVQLTVEKSPLIPSESSTKAELINSSDGFSVWAFGCKTEHVRSTEQYRRDPDRRDQSHVWQADKSCTNSTH